MKNDRTVSDFAEDGADLYPHLKITAEVFPRVLATRVIEDDDAEYFGAFLTKTAVRILIDFVNRTFKLRSCTINIDGSFPVPCTQFYRKRCIAPCVESLSDKEHYGERVSLVGHFLANRRDRLISVIGDSIERSAEALDFEQAAQWRDMALAVKEFWNNPRLDVWLDDTVDTFDTDETAAGSFIYLVTQRGSVVLGRKVFRLPRGGGLPPHEALERIVSSFYRFHLPKEIRVSIDFEGRGAIARELTEKFGRQAKIVLVKPDKQRITSLRALQNTWSENELDFLKQKPTPRQIKGELRRMLGLAELPSRVEAFDVAHISGKDFVSATSVWEDGRFLPDEYEFHISTEQAEPAAMAYAVRGRLVRDGGRKPDLILLDGGRSQINAVRLILDDIGAKTPVVVGAVKPAGQHGSIKHFLAEGDQIDYESDNPAHHMLQLLRDDAHDLANRVHRDLRDMGHHYELASLLPSLTEAERLKVVASIGSLRKIREAEYSNLVGPLGTDIAERVTADIYLSTNTDIGNSVPVIVPIGYVAEDGNADDLRPIDYR